MKLDKTSPLFPTPYNKQQVGAIQALMRGDATEAQQKLALDYIINDLCRTYDEPYHPNQRETDVAIGKSHVGRELVKLTKISLGTLKE